MRKRFLSLIFLLPAPILAQGVSTSASSLKLPDHAIAASLGDIAVVLPGSAEASAFNPANTFSVDDRVTVFFSHASWIQDVSGQRLSAAIPLPFGRLSLGVASTTVAGIEVRDIPGPPITTFDAHTAVVRGAYAAPIIGGIVAGIGASYVYEKIYANETSGFGIDAGILAATPIEGLVLAGSLTQAGSLEPFRNQRQDLPTTVRVGAQYTLDAGDFVIRPAAAWGSQIHNSVSGLTIGGSMTYDSLLTVRASWKTGESAQSLSIGAGITVDRISVHVGVVPFSSGLGTGQVFSLSIIL